MYEEELSAPEACDAVLRDNLFGLEIDPRCTQIAAFALALAAWTYPEGLGYRVLPELNIACSGVSLNVREEEWVALTRGNASLRAGLARLFTLFKEAPILGSLIDPLGENQADLLSASFDQVESLLITFLNSGGQALGSEVQATGVAAHGLARAAQLLARRYDLITTNVPYLGRNAHSEALEVWADRHAPDARADLATMFVHRLLSMLNAGGATAVVTPQNWLFLSRYTAFRQRLLRHYSWHTVAKLGPGAFETIGGEVVKAALVIMSREAPGGTGEIVGIDVSDVKRAGDKARALLGDQVVAAGREHRLVQAAQLHNPDARIILGDSAHGALFSEYASSIQGLATSDDPQFVFGFWEMPVLTSEWKRLQGPVTSTVPYGGRENVLLWEDGKGRYFHHAMGLKRIGRLGGWKSGGEAWGKIGISVAQIGKLPCTIYTGEMFDHAAHVILPKSPKYLSALWAFCQSRDFADSVRRIDQKLTVTNNTLVKIPFDLEHWQQVANSEYPDGLPAPYSNTPDQWLFHGSVRRSSAPLQVAVARLLGYCWPEQHADHSGAGADKDGIVCLPAVGGELPAADRLRALLAAIYGVQWTVTKQDEVLSVADVGGTSLESWLRDDFFGQHCTLFHQRPFIWHVWDGRKDGFSALVNYHKLDRHNLQRLAFAYLGDWIKQQETDANAGRAGADLRLAAARELQRKLELIVEGEAPYDIFVRWKPIEQQSIGWEPDLKDGVRLNIRPFVEADVLRKRPSIKWTKDRGKNPPGSPWYELGEGERFNSYEEYSGGKKLTNAKKIAARQKAKGRS